MWRYVRAFQNAYDQREVWTGAKGSLSVPGDTASTCSDWTDTTAQGVVGNPQHVTSSFWSWNSNTSSCGAGLPIYCVEQ